LKLLHIIAGLKNGGAEAVLFRIISDKTYNFQHEVISLSDQGFYGELLLMKGIKVTTLNITSPISVFSGFLRLLSLIKLSRPDIVQTWMYHADILGGIAAKIIGIKKIIWGVHTTFLHPEETKKTTKIAVNISKYLSYLVPTKIICCSETALKSHEKIGYDSSKLMIINNGFDTDAFRPDLKQRNLVRNMLSLDDNVFVIGMIARWHPVKHHEMLLEALKKIKSSNFEWKCLLIGDEMNDENEKLNLLINQYGLKNYVMCLGPRQDMPSVINALDVHILTSSSESFGNVTAEAMSCGVPCIMTNVGEASNLLFEVGWIVPIRNSSSLADCIKDVHKESLNLEKWNLQKLNSRKKIQDNYSIQYMISSYSIVWS
jgi:glycosyltransferase involved in cell wall biosynthesis